MSRGSLLAAQAVADRAAIWRGVESVTGFLALVGPPAAGKSTVSAALVAQVGAQVFKLREFARQCRDRQVLPLPVFASTDRLGWLHDDAVEALLTAAFVDGGFPAQGPVVLESLPGTAAQLRLVLTATGARLSVVELAADDASLAARASSRRVCASCEAEPRRPAVASMFDRERCGQCGDQLQRRDDDDPTTFAARLDRFRRHIPTIRHEAAAAHVPYRVVGPGSVENTVSAVRAALVDATGVQANPIPSLI